MNWNIKTGTRKLNLLYISVRESPSLKLEFDVFKHTRKCTGYGYVYDCVKVLHITIGVY